VIVYCVIMLLLQLDTLIKVLLFIIIIIRLLEFRHWSWQYTGYFGHIKAAETPRFEHKMYNNL
jgi:hypothetical protein